MYFYKLFYKNSFLFCNTIEIGKTLLVLLYILIGYVYLVLFLKVQEDTKNGISLRHNIPRHLLRMLDSSCPFTKATLRPFCCVCDSKSPLYRHKPRIAPTLISGQNKLTLAQASKFNKVFSNSKQILAREKYLLRMCQQEKRLINKHYLALTLNKILKC